ncbi:Crp/Fnr family transcriptional regulator [Aquimarina sp. D1M17]|uniref:Crp/Fnr family transcriptional regulator n=1 Tax=Aquimarina acroporae TaxID=2937283 RepID=UPI0020BEADB8|nr:Crp/Fnr family transcriptional regulator [Aquimarina acroporae]MCK8524350.1 Crp/Fnr family transcriptional regulator [Aquimarina acroporae]
MSIVDQMIKGEDFTPSEIRFIESKFKTVSFKKGDVILKAGDQTTHQYYVHDGCLRTFFIDYSGKEHTLQFAVKDWWISDYTAFFDQENAILTIECLEEAILYKVFRKDLELIYKEIPKVETYFRKKLEKAFSSFQNRILSNLANPAKARYLDFITTYPDIEAKIKNYHIASYLGITTESLSRIRKELVNH